MKKVYAVIYKDENGKVYQARATNGEFTHTIPVKNSSETTVKKALRSMYRGCEIWVSQEVKSE